VDRLGIIDTAVGILLGQNNQGEAAYSSNSLLKLVEHRLWGWLGLWIQDREFKKVFTLGKVLCLAVYNSSRKNRLLICSLTYG